ncbi:MAG TPA: hypothetical protein VG940_06375, partial [Gemmatimonadales bacterium]|nr:hypothetical protein [Gemmatimonadales bacterium]
MRERLHYLAVAVLVLLLALQLFFRFTRHRARGQADVFEARVGAVIPPVAVSSYSPNGETLQSDLGAVIKPDCAVLIVVDSDCKGCRDALEVWSEDTTWSSMRARLRWLTITDGDTAAIVLIRRIDPSANISGLQRSSDLLKLGVRVWPAALVLDGAGKILARPA